jgi:hypothetical protein
LLIFVVVSTLVLTAPPVKEAVVPPPRGLEGAPDIADGVACLCHNATQVDGLALFTYLIPPPEPSPSSALGPSCAGVTFAFLAHVLTLEPHAVSSGSLTVDVNIRYPRISVAFTSLFSKLCNQFV